VLDAELDRIALNANAPNGNVCDWTAFPKLFERLYGRVWAHLASGKTLNLTMSTQQQSQLPTIERIERALVLLAYFIGLDGDVHLAMYEKFEAELKELKRKEDTKARARKLLLSYSESGALKAIC
jgi:hypothetical protein